MKLYQVTDADGNDFYFQDKQKAHVYFNRCVDYFNRRVDDWKKHCIVFSPVEMAIVKINLNVETLLALLNGDGGYIEERQVIKQASFDEANRRGTK